MKELYDHILKIYLETVFLVFDRLPPAFHSCISPKMCIRDRSNGFVYIRGDKVRLAAGTMAIRDLHDQWKPAFQLYIIDDLRKFPAELLLSLIHI